MRSPFLQQSFSAYLSWVSLVNTSFFHLVPMSTLSFIPKSSISPTVTISSKYTYYQWEVIWWWCVGIGLAPSKLSFSKYLIQILQRNCTGTRHGQQWPVNGANVEIFTNCFWMHWNLTWIDYSHALTIWRVFGLKFDWHTHFLPSSIHHGNHKPYFSYVLVDMLMIPSFMFVFDWRSN